MDDILLKTGIADSQGIYGSMRYGSWDFINFNVMLNTALPAYPQIDTKNTLARTPKIFLRKPLFVNV